MLEAGRFHLLSTQHRHNFQVSNKEDTEDSVQSDLNKNTLTTFLNTIGMPR